ncbi:MULTISPECIES: hypothetical protein [unclassified Psychrobacter]|uniref:hypothetical protein n=1 Tax=unclassified Psychrobacter TaxID=196806 RepID=UPI000427D0B3|nr:MULTISPECIES: hypothetical protein [unclassified Psychrobacter]
MKSSFNRSVFLARLYGLGLMLAIVPATSTLAILPMLAEMYQYNSQIETPVNEKQWNTDVDDLGFNDLDFDDLDFKDLDFDEGKVIVRSNRGVAKSYRIKILEYDMRHLPSTQVQERTVISPSYQ